MSVPTHPTTARSRRSALAIGMLFLLTSVFTLAVPVATLAWSSGTFSSTSESDLVAMTNRARASAGLKALKVDSTLHTVARWRSKDMIDRNYFSHSIPGYGKVWDKLNAIGYCYNVAGENIGWNNYPDDIATAAIQQAFMDSAGHRANIMGKTWDVIGIGAYKGPTGKKMWTVLFADKCGSTAPKPTPKPTPAGRPHGRRPGRPRSPPPGRRRDRRPKPAAAATPQLTPAPTPELGPESTAPLPGDNLIFPAEPAAVVRRGAVGADLDPAWRSRPGGRAPGGRSPDLGWIAWNDRRRSGRLLLRRWMMTVATRAPRRATPDPVATDRDAGPRVAEASSPMPVILEAHDLTKSYPLGSTVVEALRGVSLTVQAGEFVALMGPSGSGKSTLLQVLGGLDRPTTGEVILEGETISELSDDRATRLRRDRTGFVFQSFNLIPLLDASENVGLPFTIAGEDPTRGELAERVRDAIGLVDLVGKEHHKPDQLSAGEQQRVAIARALVDPAGPPVRRRADRQPRLHDRHRDPRCPVALVRRARPDGRPRHP